MPCRNHRNRSNICLLFISTAESCHLQALSKPCRAKLSLFFIDTASDPYRKQPPSRTPSRRTCRSAEGEYEAEAAAASWAAAQSDRAPIESPGVAPAVHGGCLRSLQPV